MDQDGGGDGYPRAKWGIRRPARRHRAADILVDGGRAAPRTVVRFGSGSARSAVAGDTAQQAVEQALTDRLMRIGLRHAAELLAIQPERLAERIGKGDVELLLMLDAIEEAAA